MLTRTQRDTWVRELRNPNNNQARGSLYNNFTKYFDWITGKTELYPAPSRCCLGVLTECVFGSKPEDMHSLGYLNNEDILGAAEIDEYEYTFPDPEPFSKQTLHGQEIFAVLNDQEHWNFNQIADLIETFPVEED